MKKVLLFAVAVGAGTAAAFLYLSKKTVLTMAGNKEPHKLSHHVTDVFAKAKM